MCQLWALVLPAVDDGVGCGCVGPKAAYPIGVLKTVGFIRSDGLCGVLAVLAYLVHGSMEPGGLTWV